MFGMIFIEIAQLFYGAVPTKTKCRTDKLNKPVRHSIITKHKNNIISYAFHYNDRYA